MIVMIFIILFKDDIKSLFRKKSHKRLKKIWQQRNDFIMNIVVFAVGIFTLKYFNLKLVYILLSLTSFGIAFILSTIWLLEFEEKYDAYQSLCQCSQEMSAQFKEHKKITQAIRSLENDPAWENHVDILDENGRINIQKVLTYSNHYIFISMLKMMQHHEKYGDKNIMIALAHLEKDFEVWLHDINVYYANCYEYIRQINLIIILTMLVAIMGQNMLLKTGYLKMGSNYQRAYFYFFMSNVIIYLQAHTLFKKEILLKEESVVKETI